MCSKFVARAIGVEVIWIETKGIASIEPAFSEALGKAANGILVVDTGALGEACEKISTMALAHRIPAVASWRGNIQTALLLTFTADDAHLQRNAASYVDRLLRRAKPSDLPIKQASRFDLVVNLKVAKELACQNFHPRNCRRASQVIESIAFVGLRCDC